MNSRKILLFVAAVIAVLSLAAFIFPEEGISIGKLHLRYPTLHSLLREEVAEEPAATDTTTVPTVMTLKDSVDYYAKLVDSGDLRFWLPNHNYFDSMWANMEQARIQKRTVRVLHYGDSQIEMDHMTSRLRANLQETFGGGGPGMLPFRTITPTTTVKQSNHGDLIHLASFGDSLAVKSNGNYGPMMQSFRLEGGNATVTVKAATTNRVDNRAKKFNRIQLISNNRSGLNYEITNLKNKKERHNNKTSQHGVGIISWQTDTITDGFKMQISGNADLYAVLIDSDSGGVAVDNIPMRGCSGQQFTLVNKDLLTSSYATMDIGLIIMQFGGNSVPYFKDTAQISTYCRSIGKQIDHLHSCCPKARILFIGPSDMSKRIKGEMQTYPMIPVLIDSLIATANAHDAAYWSIYHAMGGWNTMPIWSRQGLAGKDYIHFSQKGADLMGDRLSEALSNSYKLYQLEKRYEAQKPVVKAKKAQGVKKKAKVRKGRRKKGGRR